MTSVRKFWITLQNLFKNRKLLSTEKFGNILAFDNESKKTAITYIRSLLFLLHMVLNKISIIEIWQGSEYASSSEYASLHRVL